MEKHHYLPLGGVRVILLVQLLRCVNLYGGYQFNWKDYNF